MHIAILSSLTPEDLDARGGVPDGVVFFSKPVNYDELRAVPVQSSVIYGAIIN
jgi:hypothetical protein